MISTTELLSYREEWEKWYALLVPFLEMHNVVIEKNHTCYGTLWCFPSLITQFRCRVVYRGNTIAFPRPHFVIHYSINNFVQETVEIENQLEDPKCDAEAILNKILFHIQNIESKCPPA